MDRTAPVSSITLSKSSITAKSSGCCPLTTTLSICSHVVPLLRRPIGAENVVERPSAVESITTFVSGVVSRGCRIRKVLSDTSLTATPMAVRITHTSRCPSLVMATGGVKGAMYVPVKSSVR